MAWTTPRTWTVGEVPTAAIFNAHVRDNFGETPPAKVTTAGDLPYASGANVITRLPIGCAGDVLALVSGVPAWVDGTATVKAIIDKRKASDETVSSSTTLQDDADFSFAIAANETWAVTLYLYVTQSSTGGWKSDFTVPAGATGWHGILIYAAGASEGVDFQPDVTVAVVNTVSATDNLVIIEAVIVNGANAGTVQLRWAQNAAAGDTVVKGASSFMERQKLN